MRRCSNKHGEGQEWTQPILQSVDRIDRYIEQLLEYARSDPSRIASVNPADILHKTLAAGNAALSSSKISLEFEDLRATSGQISADPAVLEHVFTSIINNAVEAMKSNGILQISVYEKGADNVVVRFSDSGPGIPKSQIKKILVGNVTTKDRGFGLGLAMARNAVERWGGALSFDSEVGRGTTVSLTLRKPQ